MDKQSMRLSRPVYEALPWAYLVLGFLALIASYVERGQGWSAVLALAGLASLIGGIVVLLRRRDFRDLREQYAHSETLTSLDE
jgi:hypothetical protein